MALVSAGGVLASAWIPFAVVLVLLLIFSCLYVRYYRSSYDSELSSTLTAILGLFVALLTGALVPVDVFLVSYMKDADGGFKPWAADNGTRAAVQDGVLYTYYALYLCIVALAFLLMPLVYFYYEEKDDDAETPCHVRLCGACKYAIAFVIVAAILLVVGVFVPWRAPPGDRGATEWQRLELLFHNFAATRGEDAAAFVVGALSLVGFALMLVYTAYGLSAWPVALVKGSRSARAELADAVDERAQTQAEAAAIREKYADGRRMTSRDRDRLHELEESERLTRRRVGRLAEAAAGGCASGFSAVLRPLQVVAGFLLIIFAFLIVLGIVLTNVDRLLHSEGASTGYALARPRIPNPLDIVFLFCQKVFPIDYVVFGVLVMFFLLATMEALRQMGIWFLWLRLYKIRPHRTPPQGLLLTCVILMFVVLTLNVVIYSIAPQYMTFGNQHYVDYGRNATTTTTTTTTTTAATTFMSKTATGEAGGMDSNSSAPDWFAIAHQNAEDTVASTPLVISELRSCSLDAPSDECVMTRISVLLLRFFYKAWFFGACYFWGSWAFVAIFLIGLVIAVIKRPESAITGEVDGDDFEESDEELLSP